MGYYIQSDTYRISENGQINTYDRSQIHDTDLFADKAATFLESTAGGAPFFMYLSTNAPHTPAFAQQRHQSMFSDVSLPAPPSLNEPDVSDKPAWMRNTPSLTSEELGKLRQRYRQRLRSLQSVDEMVGRLVDILRETGELSNTYIVFTSDNGWFHGEHRIREGKYHPYEESIRMPLLVRGPGVKAGSSTNKLTLNTDYFPTFTDLAGVTTPEYVDGRSLRPVLEGSATTWRTAFLLERHRDEQFPAPSLYGIRTSDGRKYIEYEGGFKELYDLKTDRYELNNSYNADSAPADLATRLSALKGCDGATCRSAEGP